MTILTVVLVIILAAILVVAAELYVLIREIGRLIAGGMGDRETREQAPTGQTINVNLSPIGGVGQPTAEIQGRPVKATTSSKEAPGESEAAPSGAGEESPVATKTDEGQPKAKKSGSFAVECPRCHAENSSYRVECFNCGNPL